MTPCLISDNAHIPTRSARPADRPALRLISSNDNPLSYLEADTRGLVHGYRDWRLCRVGATAAWRELAHRHALVIERLNGLLVGRVGQHTGGALDLTDPETKEAYSDLMKVCWDVLSYRTPKPRHMVDLIRCAVELMGMGDPIWFAGTRSDPTRDHVVLRRLCTMAIRMEQLA